MIRIGKKRNKSKNGARKKRSDVILGWTSKGVTAVGGDERER
jgi:hypothetical protein